MGKIILLTVIVYFGILLWIAKKTGKNQDNDTFFRGNRQSPWYVVAFGMIGASLSGVTFVSVPGMPQVIDLTYMQTCIGFFFGYLVIAHILLPLYYRLNLTSIYGYLGKRFGRVSYKTGASFFLLSKMIGAAVRLYLVCMILQRYVFDTLHVPFLVTISVTVLLIWLYTYRSGIKTIVWTDSLQTFCMLAALVLIFYEVMSRMGIGWSDVPEVVRRSGHDRIFVFDDWQSRQNFFKQFFSGIFITIVMTGLDQDMMQKNLSCRNLREARRNMYTYGFSFIPVNLLFLTLGILLLTYGQQQGLTLPTAGDELLPFFAAEGRLGLFVLILFSIGIIAAAFSSADSALTALTTSFCVDILGIKPQSQTGSKRKRVHFALSILFVLIIWVIRELNNKSVIDAIYTIASYTYGPLLGMFAFGLFTRRYPRDKWTPLPAIGAPVLCYFIDRITFAATGYQFGYEMLMLNGLLTFTGLYLLSFGKSHSPKINIHEESAQK
jgi:Na+/proline symporter